MPLHQCEQNGEQTGGVGSLCVITGLRPYWDNGDVMGLYTGVVSVLGLSGVISTMVQFVLANISLILMRAFYLLTDW